MEEFGVKNCESIEDIDSFIRLLSDSEKVALGGQDYEEWASQLLNLCLRHRRIVARGGLIVPQLGDKAGVPLAFGESLQQLVTDTSTLQEELARRWSHPSADAFILTIGDAKLNCVFSPISFGFDRPIGYFWALSDEDTEPVEKTLRYASILVSQCVRAKKASRALDLLSKPIWGEIDTIAKATKYAADLCLDALSCRAVVVWQVDSYRKLLRTSVACGSNCDNIRVDMSLDRGLAGACYRNNVPMRIDDLWQSNTVEHKQLVRDKDFRSAIFIPLDAGGAVIGVLGAYGARPNAFSKLDEDVASAIAQWLCSRYVQQSRIDEVLLIKRKIDLEMPLIQAGISAMERVHDAKNELVFAQNDLSEVTRWIRQKYSGSKSHTEVLSASKHIEQANALISGLVSQSKLAKSNFKACDLRTLITEARNLLRSQKDEINAVITFDCPENAFIRGDAELLKRVFGNLLDNALHFLEKKAGKRKIEVVVEDHHSSVMIKVKDNGPGISPYDIGKVFDVFFTTKGDRGMGFGLAIAKRIIEEHGGTISVASHWGDFAEFTIILPRVG